MSLRLTWPAYRAALTSHTVEVAGRLVAGYLVRDTGTRRDLGYVWASGSSWQWRASASQYGERSSQEAAVRQLRDIADLGTEARPVRLPFEVEPEPAPRPRPAARAKVQAVVEEPEPARRVVWADTSATDLTAAIKRRLEKK